METRESDHEASAVMDNSTTERPLLPLTKRDATPAAKASNSLAYLDGIRGIAALIVYFHHHISEFYGNDCDLMHAWGYQGRHRLGQLPFLQLFFAGGTPAVMVFFVLSGYVLSRGALSMVESGKATSSIHKYLFNALLRRPIRLWLPPILVSLPVAIAFHTPLRPVGAFIFYKPNLSAELQNWFVNLLETVNPFIGHGPFMQSFQYDPPVWTMAYELNGSVAVYAAMAAAPFLTARNRVIALVVSLPFAFKYAHFSLLPFVFGVLLAQIDVAKLDKEVLGRMPEQRRTLMLNATFFVGWWLLSVVGPAVKPEHPWWGIDPAWIPYIFFHQPQFLANIFGAFALVYAALRLSWVQGIFNRAAWLGRVSFALYLTHVPIIWLVSYRVRRALGSTDVGNMSDKSMFDGIFPIPDVGPQGLSSRYLVMQAIVLPLNLALAELATVWVDETSVTLSKQFASRITQKLHL